MSQKKHKKRKEAGQEIPALRPDLANLTPDYPRTAPGKQELELDAHGRRVLELMNASTPKQGVMIGVPTGGHPKWEFAHDLCNLIGYTALALVGPGLIDLALSWVSGCYVACNRNDLVLMARKKKVTHILFLDDDMRFPPWALEHLLARDVDIVGANYTTRKVPIRPISMLDIDWEKGDKASKCVWSQPGATGLCELDAIGGGVTLIKMSVFDKLEYPFFEQWYDMRRNRNVGEDIDFCKKALDAGFKVNIDHDLSHHVKHIGEIEHRMDLAYEAYGAMTALQEEDDGLGLVHEPQDGDSGLAESE